MATKKQQASLEQTENDGKIMVTFAQEQEANRAWFAYMEELKAVSAILKEIELTTLPNELVEPVIRLNMARERMLSHPMLRPEPVRS